MLPKGMPLVSNSYMATKYNLSLVDLNNEGVCLQGEATI